VTVLFILIFVAAAYKLTVVFVGCYDRRKHARCLENTRRLEIELGFIEDESVMAPWSKACAKNGWFQEKTTRTFNDGRQVIASSFEEEPKISKWSDRYHEDHWTNPPYKLRYPEKTTAPPMMTDPDIEGYIRR